MQRILRLKAAGDLDRAAREAEEALRLEDPAMRIELLRELADIRAKKGQWRAAQEALDKGLALAGTMDEQRDPLLERRAWIFFREGNFSDARRLCDQLIARLRDSNRVALLADLHNTLGGVAWQEGRIDDAMAAIAESISLYDLARNQAGAAHSRLNLGILCFARGDWQRARRYLVQSRRIRAASGSTHGLALVLFNLGLVEMASGKLTLARRYLDESAERSRSAGEEHEALFADMALAQIDLLENRIDDAAARLGTVMRLRQSLDGDALVQALWLQALIESRRGHLEHALELARDARRRARATGIAESDADACRALGTIYRTAGRPDDAKRALEESLAMARKANDPYRRALAELELSQVLRDPARSNAAISVFKRLGAKYDLIRAKFGNSSLTKM